MIWALNSQRSPSPISSYLGVQIDLLPMLPPPPVVGGVGGMLEGLLWDGPPVKIVE